MIFEDVRVDKLGFCGVIIAVAGYVCTCMLKPGSTVNMTYKIQLT